MALDGLEPGGVLTLDLGWRTIGWCLGWDDGEDRRVFGSWSLPKIGGRGALFTAADNIIIESIEAAQPKQVIAEDVLVVQAQTSTETAKKQMGLEAVVCMQCYRYSVLFTTVSANLVRDALLGQARFAKRDQVGKEAIAFCRRKGWAVKSDHEADAVMIYEWHRRQVRNIRPASGPLWREVTY